MEEKQSTIAGIERMEAELLKPTGIILMLIAIYRPTIAPAQDVERICRGEFTDMRVIGLTLGDCDLNSISDSEVSCGEPWRPDSEKVESPPKCAVRVIASRTKSIRPENHGYGAPLYRVRKVLVEDAASPKPRDVNTCKGILHQDQSGLSIDEPPEDTCEINATQAKKVLATCTVGQFCRVTGIIEDCKDMPSECGEITRVLSVRRR
jgi:hypothetical protein